MHVAHALSSAATISDMKTNQWVLANHNVVGYYRVHYDEANWERLLATLSSSHEVRQRLRQTRPNPVGMATDPSLCLFQRIPVINRAQLVDDAFNLARWVPGTSGGDWLIRSHVHRCPGHLLIRENR